MYMYVHTVFTLHFSCYRKAPAKKVDNGSPRNDSASAGNHTILGTTMFDTLCIHVCIHVHMYVCHCDSHTA